jgi:hypothetical protein
MFEKMLNIIREIGERLSKPVIGGFYLYLILLWLLNLADISQTVMLSRGGHLKQEANPFMDFFLSSDKRIFIIAKLFALTLITAMVVRGYTDKKGTTVGGNYYSPTDMKRAITFLLGAGVLYYLIIVLIPFITLIFTLFFGHPGDLP